MPNGGKRIRMIEDYLRKYIPEPFIPYVSTLFIKYPVKFKIVPPRKTKLGDYRYLGPNSKPQITVNGDLNPYSFLITTIHEFAHLVTFEKHGMKVQAHGTEWKEIFKSMLLPVIDTKELPKDIEQALLVSLTNVKASSCSDMNLSRTLAKYNNQLKDEIHLEQIPKNSNFVLNGRTFKKGVLRRTRFMCEEVTSGKNYLINALAAVQLLEIDGK